MTVINMTQTCKANGITSFSRTRGGWMKQVEGLDKQHSNGYSFVGSNFVKVGNFNTNIMNGLYLDQSTSIVDNHKVFTMNLFKIINGNVELLKTVPKTNGWALELWDEVEDYFKSETITAQEIVNTIREMTSNETLIEEAIDILQFDAREIESPYPFKNWFEVRSYLAEMECQNLNYGARIIEEMEVDYVIPSNYGLKYEDREIITKVLNLMNDITINEETLIDCKSIRPKTIKKEFFQLPFQMHDSFYIAHTTPNATGYHNGNIVIMFYYDKTDDVVVIRHFSYYFSTNKQFQKPVGY